MGKSYKWLGVISIACYLTACQTAWNEEKNFGSSVNGALKLQMKNPESHLKDNKPSTGQDGVSAKSAIDNYQKTFEVKTLTGAGTYSSGASSSNSSGSR